MEQQRAADLRDQQQRILEQQQQRPDLRDQQQQQQQQQQRLMEQQRAADLRDQRQQLDLREHQHRERERELQQREMQQVRLPTGTSLRLPSFIPFPSSLVSVSIFFFDPFVQPSVPSITQSTDLLFPRFIGKNSFHLVFHLILSSQ